MHDERRFYEVQAAGARRSAPAALRNRGPIAEALSQWLPPSGLVLEIASGTGEHVVYFAERFPALEWQPSDIHPEALASMRAWREEAQVPNVREPLFLDASSADWRIERTDAVVSINMIHISPWSSALGLIEGSARVLPAKAPLILYGPWFTETGPAEPSNLAFHADLMRRNAEWGLRKVKDFARAARKHFELVETRSMPANNLMLLLRRR